MHKRLCEGGEHQSFIGYYVKMYLLHLKLLERNDLILKPTETEYMTNDKINIQESHKIAGRHLQRNLNSHRMKTMHSVKVLNAKNMAVCLLQWLSVTDIPIKVCKTIPHVT